MLRDLDLPWPHGSCIRFLAAPLCIVDRSSREPPCYQIPVGRVVLFLGCSRRIYESLFLTTSEHHLVPPQRLASTPLPSILDISSMCLPGCF